MNVLRLQLPDGHLSPHVATVLKKASYEIPNYGPGRRIYHPEINVKQFRVTVRRPMQIAIDLARAEADAAITGLDCICEFPGAELLIDLQNPVTRLMLAIPDVPEFSRIRDFRSFLRHICPRGVTIYAEYPRFVRQHIAEHPAYRSKYKEPPGLDLGWEVIRSGSPIVVRLSFGATEGNRFFADTAQTSTTININGSRAIHTLLDRSTPWLAASSHALSDLWKRAQIIELQSRLKALTDHSMVTPEGTKM